MVVSDETFFPFPRHFARHMMTLLVQNTLGNAFRDARMSQRLTQAAVAAKARVSLPTIRLLENGRGNLRSWHAALDALVVEIIGRNLLAGKCLGRQMATLRK